MNILNITSRKLTVSLIFSKVYAVLPGTSGLLTCAVEAPCGAHKAGPRMSSHWHFITSHASHA